MKCHGKMDLLRGGALMMKVVLLEWALAETPGYPRQRARGARVCRPAKPPVTLPKAEMIAFIDTRAPVVSACAAAGEERANTEPLLGEGKPDRLLPPDPSSSLSPTAATATAAAAAAAAAATTAAATTAAK
ncbi:unnamed protein product [Lota lota]